MQGIIQASRVPTQLLDPISLTGTNVYICSGTHVLMHTGHRRVHKCTHACTPPPHSHARIHPTHTRVCMHACTNSNTHTRTPPPTLTCLHACVHKLTPTPTHSHTRACRRVHKVHKDARTCQEKELAEQILASGLALNPLRRHALCVQHQRAIPGQRIVQQACHIWISVQQACHTWISMRRACHT